MSHTPPDPQTSPSAPSPENPFVGPRPFERGQRLYGRDREVLDLLDLLIAERIVLLHSPSGAGKTSLIQAGLVPGLEDEEFRVLPTIRVGAPGTTDADNRYLLSAMLALEEAFPREERLRPSQLAAMTFDAYLSTRFPTEDDDALFLIFDQFEEILSVDPADTAGKEHFFAQVGEALRNRQRWALFAMREEYVARMEMYSRVLPTRFGNTFQLTLLRPDAATAAITGPADGAFTPRAVRALVDDLRTVVEEDAAGAPREVLGNYVEPVQLQVVCRDLWQRYSPSTDNPIAFSTITDYGDIDQALRRYYAHELNGVIAATDVDERALRDWFGRNLIQSGIRAQVRYGPRVRGRYVNGVLNPLVNAHLVRTETRRGATWYELAHDRLIEPILADNEEWRQTHLNELQRQAELWDMQDQPKGLLLLGAALDEAERWAADARNNPTDTESQFLAASRDEQNQIDRDERQERRIRYLAVGALILALAAAAAAALAWMQTGEARRQETRAAAAQATAVIDATNAVIARNTAQADADRANRAEERAQAEATRALQAQSTAQAEAERALQAQATAQAEARAARSNELVFYARDRMEEFGGADDTALILARDAVAVTRNEDTYATVNALTTLSEAMAHHYAAAQFPETRHAGAINAVAVSPDGSFFATAGEDGTAILWHTDNGSAYQVLTGHTAAIDTLAFSADGSRIVTAGEDGAAMIWNTEDGSLHQRLTGHRGQIYSANFNPAGERIVTGGRDRTVIIWDVATGAIESILAGHEDEVGAVDFSPDGRLIASAGADGRIILWDAATGIPQALIVCAGDEEQAETGGGYAPLQSNLPALSSSMGSSAAPAAPSLTGCHQGGIRALSFNADGSRLLSGGTDETVRLWDLDPPALRQVFIGHDGAVETVRFSPDGEQVAAAGDSRRATIWSIDAPESPSASPAGHAGSTTDIAFLSNGGGFLTVGTDATTLLWDESLTQAGVIPRHAGQVRSVDWSPDQRMLVTTGSEGSALIWNPESSAILQALTHPPAVIQFAAFSHDGSRIVTTGTGLSGSAAAQTAEEQSPVDLQEPPITAAGYAAVWDSATGEVVTLFNGHDAEVQGAAFSPDDGRVASADSNGDILIWSTATGDQEQVLTGHRGRVNAVDFNHDGTQLVSAGQDRTAIVWDAVNGVPLVTLTGHRSPIRDVRFSTDGSRVVTASQDGSAIIWDVATGVPITTLSGHDNWLYGADFSPDGSRVVTASGDRTAIVWDARTGAILRTLLGHNSILYAARFSPDGRRIATASADRTARTWDVEPAAPPSLTGHRSRIQDVAVSPDGERILTGSIDETAVLWQRETLTPTARLLFHTSGVNSVDFSADGARGLTAGSDGVTAVWDLQGKVPVQAATLRGSEAEITSARFGPDGKLAVTGDAAGNVIVWDTLAATAVNTLARRSGVVNAVDFAPDGRHIAAGGDDRLIQIQDVIAGGAPRFLAGHDDSVNAVAFSHDGARLASGSEDGSAIIWDLATETPMLTVRGQTAAVRTVDFSPDDGTLLTGGADGTVILWDVATGHPTQVLTGHESDVRAAAFSADGGLILAAGDDHTALIFTPVSLQDTMNAIGEQIVSHIQEMVGTERRRFGYDE